MNPRRDEAVSAEKVRGLRSAHHAQAQPLDPGNRPGPVARPPLRIHLSAFNGLRSEAEPERPSGGEAGGLRDGRHDPLSPAFGT